MTSKVYKVTVSGCDDYSEVMMALDESQVELLKLLETKVNDAQDYGCKPSMEVEELNDGDD